MAFCKYCGHELENDAVFCAKCGKEIASNNTRRSSNKKRIIIKIIYFIFVALSLIIGLKEGYRFHSSVYGSQKNIGWYGVEFKVDFWDKRLPNYGMVNETYTENIVGVSLFYVVLISAPFCIDAIRKGVSKKKATLKSNMPASVSDELKDLEQSTESTMHKETSTADQATMQTAKDYSVENELAAPTQSHRINKKAVIITIVAVAVAVAAGIGIFIHNLINSSSKLQLPMPAGGPAIAAGNITMGLTKDGTVIIAGDSNGYYDVSGWENIVKVAPGTSSVFGLRSDGTVIYCGASLNGTRPATEKIDFDETAVSEWENIVDISAGNMHTMGLMADGTVVSTPFTDDSSEYPSGGTDEVSSWKNITAVVAGGFHTVGLKEDGTVVAIKYTDRSGDFGQCNVSDWTDIVAIDAGTAFTVGLRSDGTVVAVGNNETGQCNVSDWTDIIAISAGTGHTVGLKADGTVVATGFIDNPIMYQVYQGQCDVSDWTDIIAVSAGNNFTVGLKSDGTVVATKYITAEINGVVIEYNGQCDVEGWNLLTAEGQTTTNNNSSDTSATISEESEENTSFSGNGSPEQNTTSNSEETTYNSEHNSSATQPSNTEGTTSNSGHSSSTTQPPNTAATTSSASSSEKPPAEESVDYKSEAKAFLDATTFEVNTPIRVQDDYIYPTVKVILHHSDRAEKLGWRVDFYVNDTKQTLRKSGSSSYEFEQEWDFSVSLKPGNNSIKFELRDNYGNSKIITKDVYFEALAPDCASTISTYIQTLSYVEYSPHWSELEQMESCGYLSGYGLNSNEHRSYNNLCNLTITVNGITYTPIIMDGNHKILKDGSSSIFTPIVVEPAYGNASVYIPVDLSQGKTITITFTNQYGLSDTTTVTFP